MKKKAVAVYALILTDGEQANLGRLRALDGQK